MGQTGTDLLWLFALGCGLITLLNATKEGNRKASLPALLTGCFAGFVYRETGEFHNTQWLIAACELAGFVWLNRLHKDQTLAEERERERLFHERMLDQIRDANLIRLREEQWEAKVRSRTERRLNERREKAVAIQKRAVKKGIPLQTSSGPSGLKAVAGMEHLKKVLREEVVDVFRHRERFQKYGINIPNGILLYGPAGCGKTFIARQLAIELKYYFIEVSPSDIADTYIHGSTLKIRSIFDRAISAAPSVLFIDEFEAVVPDRAVLHGHQYKAEEVNEFLARMATCSENRVLLIVATNAPGKIDLAVQRSGRIDRKVYVDPPDPLARKQILAQF
jgi:transitional endoplasmic reticulum ATPase